MGIPWSNVAYNFGKIYKNFRTNFVSVIILYMCMHG